MWQAVSDWWAAGPKSLLDLRHRTEKERIYMIGGVRVAHSFQWFDQAHWPIDPTLYPEHDLVHRSCHSQPTFASRGALAWYVEGCYTLSTEFLRSPSNAMWLYSGENALKIPQTSFVLVWLVYMKIYNAIGSSLVHSLGTAGCHDIIMRPITHWSRRYCWRDWDICHSDGLIRPIC
jgi:hypothetical protein